MIRVVAQGRTDRHLNRMAVRQKNKQLDRKTNSSTERQKKQKDRQLMT
jgi:hypothetical protein